MANMDLRFGSASARRAIRVRGVVQGVGFRPSVVRLARGAGLTGFVRNDSEGVWIEVEGGVQAVDGFASLLRAHAPALARIDSLACHEVEPRGDRDFRVEDSVSTDHSGALVPVDAATCDACVRELFDPRDRRYRYPFINCTDCGPRFTIVIEVPYDRARTTMAAFRMCSACSNEYDDPSNRRYHAEPNACPACGPRVTLVEAEHVVARDDGAIVGGIARIERGAIVAVKGLGGYQLALDARNDSAVDRLRARKRRPHKPLALMARDMAVVHRIAQLTPAAHAALSSPARPIVLLPRRHDAQIAANVAPGSHEIGVMLPATALHHMLLERGPDLLVVTSGNRADEPIALDEAEANEALVGIADATLVHDRPIHTRTDDSVVRVVASAVQPVRRARGFVPDAVALPGAGPCVLAVGAQLKSTVCVTRGSEACLSQHIGDLDGVKARDFFEETIAKLNRLLGVRPEVVAHDLHPDYASTRWALGTGLPTIAVQHHHAHVVSCMAEHGHLDPVIGVAFDGTGCGPEGELWGGELLLADRARFRRLGALRPIRLPGGEAAIREPWRAALSVLIDAGVSVEALHLPGDRARAVGQILARGVCSPAATGAGRWFDAIAAILGLREAISYEGQAAVELEALAARGSDVRAYSFEIEGDEPFSVDLRPVARAVWSDLHAHVHPADIALRFHRTIATAVARGCVRARAAHGVNVVALSGGCFQNRILSESTLALLERDGFDVLLHRKVPPNDGGVALGQAAVAHFRTASASTTSKGAPRVPRHPW